MIIPKKAIFDRIEQSFSFFTKNFWGLFLPIFMYYFLFVTIYGIIAYSFSSWYLGEQFFIDLKQSFIGVGSSLDIFNILFINPKVITLFSISMFFTLLFSIIIIPFSLSLIRSIDQAYNDIKITVKENLLWGFKRIIESFKTYWYMFIYAYMLPSIIFIIFGFSFLYFDGFSNYKEFIMPFGIFMLVSLIYIAYRTIKMTFSIISAASLDDFTDTNFNTSVKITNKNWWRILGNILLLGIILITALSISGGIISSIISVIFPSVLVTQISSIVGDLMTNNLMGGGSIDAKSISTIIDSIDIKEISSFQIGDFLKSILENIISSIKLILTTIFMYFFFKRLKLEERENI